MSNYSDSAFSDDPNSSWNKVFNFVKPGSKVLDIGCSSGNFGKTLIDKKNCIVDGLEIDDKDFKDASKKLRNVYQLNIETDDLSPISDTYDYIYFGDVIEHLVDPVRALRRLEPLFTSKKKAQLLFSLPNMSHISVRMMLLNGAFEYGKTGLLDNTHLHFYTLDELTRVFRRAGMEISTFDPVVKDYPKKLLDTELKKVGLKNTEEFTDFINTTNASIYQLVGIATYAEKPKQVRMEVSSPRDKFSGLLTETEAYFNNRLAESEAHIKKLEDEVRRLGSEKDQLELRLNRPIVDQIKDKIRKKGA